MKHDTIALIRVVILVVLILALVGFCIIEAGSAAPKANQDTETTATTTAIPEETTQETQATTEPHTIPEEETEPTQETNAATTTTEPPAPTSAEPPTDTKPSNPDSTYTEVELEMLAIVIYREAGSNACSDETRLMVGTVVMNRIASKRFPNTMHGVLTQKSQYGRMHWTGVVWPKRASNPGEANAVKRAYAIAERILQGERALPEDVVFQAEFKQGKEVVAYQDGIYFCR